MHEARIEETEHGRRPADDGWYILNLAEVVWETVPGGGIWSLLESPAAPWKRLGFGVHILPPGETPGFYHFENDQEGFLVLSGECIADRRGPGAPDGSRGTTCTPRPGRRTSRSAPGPATSRARS